jgi:hypothetical protein
MGAASAGLPKTATLLWGFHPAMSQAWTKLRLARTPFFTSVFITLNDFYVADVQEIESDPITNSVPPALT